MKVFLCRLLAFSSVLFLGVALTAAKTDAPTPSYLGSKSCSTCHANITKAWKDSHHAWAWKKPNGQSVLGNFADKMFKHKSGVSRFTKSGNKFFVETDGADGRSQKFEVVGTVGVDPLQQYLVETKPGRVQALDLAWDTQKLMWYDLYPDQNLPPTGPVRIKIGTPDAPYAMRRDSRNTMSLGHDGTPASKPKSVLAARRATVLEGHTWLGHETKKHSIQPPGKP